MLPATLALWSTVTAQETIPDPAPAFSVSDARINESSGLASSRAAAGVFYTHNDSGDVARFFRFNRKGEITGVFQLDGVQAIDWEDMAAARIGGNNFLYLGDIGDNARRRKEIRVYRCIEPPLDRDRAMIRNFEVFTIQYPEGRAYDCESLAVDPRTGDLYLFTKARKTEVFRVKAPRATGTYRAERVGEFEFPQGGLGSHLATGADWAPDGNWVVVRSYTLMAEFEASRLRRGDVKWFSMERLPLSRQGEAVAYTKDNDHHMLSSEGNPCPIWILPIVRG